MTEATPTGPPLFLDFESRLFHFIPGLLCVQILFLCIVGHLFDFFALLLEPLDFILGIGILFLEF